MALSIINNVTSLNAQNNLTKTSGSLAKSLERLSSGLKINRGADGPAGLVISEQQRAQITGLRAALDNTNKAVSVVQTGEGALNEINRLLGKVRGLALDSANLGVNDTNALAANQSEITNALSTITNIANTTQFGTKKLLDGSRALTVTDNNANASAVASGTVAAGSYSVSGVTAATRAHVTSAVVADAAMDGTSRQETLTINGVNINFVQVDTDADASRTAAQNAINAVADQTGVRASIDNANDTMYLYSTNWGSGNAISVSSSLAAADSILGTPAGNVDGTNVSGSIAGTAGTGSGNVLSATSGAGAGIKVTFASQATGDTYTSATNNPFTSDATATTVTVDAANALVFQIGANQGQTASIALNDARATALGQGASGTFASLSAITVTGTSATIGEAIKVVDAAISEVSVLRGQLGAFQANTLESNANNLRATLENTTSAESVVRDTDFAEEMAMFTKTQVMMQAGQTVLGNANQIPQLVAALLRG